MKHRWDILAEIINKNNYQRIVEIGVSRGDNAEGILKLCPQIKEFYLIDPDPNGVFNYGSFCNSTAAKFIRLKSEEAFTLFYNKKLDLVFIDGEHSYDAVIREILLYQPLIRLGGVISGHDWLINDNDKDNGVNKAVSTLLKDVNLEQDGDHNNVKIWWKYV